MPKDKSVTKKETSKALDRPVTKKEMSDALQEATQEVTDTILNGVGEIMKDVKKDMNTRFDQVDGKLQNVQAQVNNLEHDTPTRGEFERLEKKVRRYHPAN